VLLKAKELGIKLTLSYWISPGHNMSENHVVIFIESSKSIGNKCIITERSPYCSELISIMAHLGIILGHREVKLLGRREGNS
jgi:hypothetical protein